MFDDLTTRIFRNENGEAVTEPEDVEIPSALRPKRTARQTADTVTVSIGSAYAPGPSPSYRSALQRVQCRHPSLTTIVTPNGSYQTLCSTCQQVTIHDDLLSAQSYVTQVSQNNAYRAAALQDDLTQARISGAVMREHMRNTYSDYSDQAQNAANSQQTLGGLANSSLYGNNLMGGGTVPSGLGEQRTGVLPNGEDAAASYLQSYPGRLSTPTAASDPAQEIVDHPYLRHTFSKIEDPKPATKPSLFRRMKDKFRQWQATGSLNKDLNPTTPAALYGSSTPSQIAESANRTIAPRLGSRENPIEVPNPYEGVSPYDLIPEEVWDEAERINRMADRVDSWSEARDWAQAQRDIAESESRSVTPEGTLIPALSPPAAWRGVGEEIDRVDVYRQQSDGSYGFVPLCREAVLDPLPSQITYTYRAAVSNPPPPFVPAHPLDDCYCDQRLPPRIEVSTETARRVLERTAVPLESPEPKLCGQCGKVDNHPACCLSAADPIDPTDLPF